MSSDRPRAPGGANADGAAIVRRALAALGREDPDGFVALVHPEVEIETARGVRRGRSAAHQWASHRYDHLVRRWRVDEIREEGDRLLAIGSVLYVWRQGEELGSESPSAVGAELDSGLIRRLRLYETVQEGLEDLERSSTVDGS